MYEIHGSAPSLRTQCRKTFEDNILADLDKLILTIPKGELEYLGEP